MRLHPFVAMHFVVAVVIVSIMSSSPLVTGDCTDCIIINSETGNDTRSCMESSTTSITPCKTISYVLTKGSLNNREIVLERDHQINQTLTISHVNGLTIRGNGSTINCIIPTTQNDTGSGLVFESVSNLKVLNVTFEDCGTLQYSTTLRDYENVKYRSAVYIINSTNIHFSESVFLRSIGRGLSLYDVDGTVVITKTNCFQNMLRINQQNERFGGGGIYIEFTYCSPGFPHCSSEDTVHNNMNSSYFITECLFKDNKATNNEVTNQPHVVQFRILPGSAGNNAGHGGGIDIICKGASFNNTIEIRNCTFFNNSANYGGGINSVFLDTAHNNTLSISNCDFINNNALKRGGGAIHFGYVILREVAYNSIIVYDTVFVNNSAGWGGAVAFFSTRSFLDVENKLQFTNCTWKSNTASVGAAVTLLPNGWNSIFDGKITTAKFSVCSFIDNIVTDTAEFLKTSPDDVSKHAVESGILDIASFQVEFSDYVTFSGNKGSAIFAESAQINVLPNTAAYFVNNTATNGGAIALIGFSILELYNGTEIVFESNHAKELGGAVYATSPNQAEFIFSHKCFISHNSITFNDPDNWNTSITFINNTAENYGYSIYADSLLPCVKQVGGIVTNISASFHWKPFTFIPKIKEFTIATSPAAIDFTLPDQIAPGERISINPVSMDDLKQQIPSAFKVTLDSSDGEIKTNPFVSNDGYLEIRGEPGIKYNLTIQTQNTRHIIATKSGSLGECPLGFMLKGDECVCSSKQVGVLECNTMLFRAFLHVGYWVGCTDSEMMMTGYCPIWFCKFENVTTDHGIIIPRSCESIEQHTLCNEHRTGQLCGECEQGYSVYYHSDNFLCGKCSYGAAGLVIYILAELLPLVILFATIMITKLKMTSGLMQSLLLFAQTVLYINMAVLAGYTPLTQTSQTFIRIHTFLHGFLNLEFLRLDELSFCLWRGATVLDNLVFRYVTTLFTILLLGMFILIVKKCSGSSGTAKITFVSKLKKLIGAMKIFNNAIVHGITTLLILSYTQYTVVSFQILSRMSLNGVGDKIFGYVVRLQGNVEYFGEHHLPYAIPAVFVLIFLSIPPPLLLISYPLLWKIKAKIKTKLRCNVHGTENDTTIWPIRKLLPFIDSFQGVFRDNRRMFAGLLFLWRFTIASIFALSSSLTEFHLLTEIALISFFAIHAIARPYKRQLYNMIDALMFGNLAIINALAWYSMSNPEEVIIGIMLLLMYIPLGCLLILTVLWLLHKFNIIPKQFQLPSTEENESSANEIFTVVNNVKVNRKDTCAEDDLFNRAEEMYHPPSLIMSGSEGEFRLQSGDINTFNTEI